MQVAREPPTFGGTEFGNTNLISACRLPNGMERLVNVTNEMDKEIQGFDARFSLGISVSQNVLEDLYPIHHTIVVIGSCILAPAGGRKTIALVGESHSILGYVNELPVVGLVPLWSNFVCPVRVDARLRSPIRD